MILSRWWWVVVVVWGVECDSIPHHWWSLSYPLILFFACCFLFLDFPGVSVVCWCRGVGSCEGKSGWRSCMQQGMKWKVRVRVERAKSEQWELRRGTGGEKGRDAEWVKVRAEGRDGCQWPPLLMFKEMKLGAGSVCTAWMCDPLLKALMTNNKNQLFSRLIQERNHEGREEESLQLLSFFLPPPLVAPRHQIVLPSASSSSSHHSIHTIWWWYDAMDEGAASSPSSFGFLLFPMVADHGEDDDEMHGKDRQTSQASGERCSSGQVEVERLRRIDRYNKCDGRRMMIMIQGEGKRWKG